MKTKILRLFIAAVPFFFAMQAFSQGVGIGTTDPNPSAGLHVSFTDKGVLIPQVDLGSKLTTLGLNAHGLMVFNTNGSILLGSGLYVNNSMTATPDWNKVSTNILGSGIATRVAFWGSPTTLSHSSALYWDNMNSRLGIGTIAPAQQLTLTGNFEMPSTSSASVGVIYKTGGYRYIHDYGNYNNFFGFAAGNFTMTGSSNIGIGDDVLGALTSGTGNTAVGDFAMPYTQSGGQNVGIGASALEQNTTGSSNLALGYEAMKSNTLCNNNIAIGESALRTQTSGSGDPETYNIAIGSSALRTINPNSSLNGRRNLAIGHEALRSGTIAYDNIALGCHAMYSNVSASANIAIGISALNSINNGSSIDITSNIAIGTEALYNMAPTTSGNGRFNIGIGHHVLHTSITGTNNIAMGYNALQASTADDNTAVGSYASSNTNSGAGNTALGSRAMYNNLDGSYNVAIGHYADMSTSGLSNSIAIGYGANAGSSNEVRLGNSAITSFYCMGIYAATTSGTWDVNVSGSGQLMRVSSSKRYKTDINDLEINTSKIYQLRPVSFTQISGNERSFGLIAEEVAGVIPELALYEKESKVVPGSDSDALVPESVRYSMLSVLLLKEVQKHQQRIGELEKRLDGQEILMRQMMEKLTELKRTAEVAER